MEHDHAYMHEHNIPHLHHPEETEIVLILCESKKVLRLMGAVEEQCGAGTETGARTFAQPVDKVEGLHYYLH